MRTLQRIESLGGMRLIDADTPPDMAMAMITLDEPWGARPLLLRGLSGIQNEPAEGRAARL